MLIALDDKVLIILSVTSVISLALGLYQTFGLPHAPGQPRVEWVDSVTILTAVAIAVVLGALNDYQKERQFAKLNRKVKDIVPCLDHTLTVIDREMIALSKQSDLESL